MEVAASLPNIMKIFPLRIMMKESSPTCHQEAFPSGHGEEAAAANADEEMEEGEIDPREITFSSSSKEALVVLESAAFPFVAQHSCPNLDCIQNTMISSTSQHLPRLSSVTDYMQLEQSVDALLSLPDKVSQQEQSWFHLSQFSSPSQPAGHFRTSPPAKNSKQSGVSCTAVGELTPPPQPACLLESSIQHGQVSPAAAREPSTLTSSLQSHHHQYSPNVTCGALGSPPESKPLVLLESMGAQPSAHAANFAASSRMDERTVISCGNGKRRLRTSAIRDYPEGCGRSLCANTNQGVVKRAFPSCPQDKVPLTVTAAKGCPLSGPSSLVPGAEQGKRKQKLVRPLQGKCKVGVTSGCLQRSYSRLEEQTVLCHFKAPNASLIPLKRHPAQDYLPHKCEKQTTTDYSSGTALKKLKIRPLSRILSCGMESPPPPLEERSSQIQWFLEDELLAARPHASRPRLQKASRKVVFSLPQNLKGLENALSSDADFGASSRFQVKRTLREFDCVRRNLAMVAKERYSRPDLAAAKILKKKGRWRNCEGEKIVGHVPGVEVGDQFSFRIEMLIVGLHRQLQGGIDYIAATVRPKGPLATSIVASGGYEDDDDCGATFIYTGQGGNNYKTDRRQGKDQVLKRGNLALSNSFKEKTPVRVIRGSTDDKFYTYDGLYDVIDCWFQTGVAGFGVYQYKLSRRPGQSELGSSIVKFMGIVKKKGLARPHLLLGDLSRGKERSPVSVLNEVDGEAAPEFFTYIPKMKYPSWYHLELSRGCDCVGGCVDASKCLCAAKNGGEFPYNEIGQIVIDKKMVFECGKSCACPSSCYNRVSQKGLKHQLEVFKTRKRGWGVRSLEPIRPGDFICEYVGELLSDADAERRTECDEYLFDIGHRTNSYMDVSDLMDISKGKAIVPVVADEGFTIDARLFGSVARFINHSCSPNLYAQDVIYDSDDPRFPHVMLFAMENIPPMRELAYDYNYTIGHVRDANGDVKSKACYCGAQDCRGRLY